MQIDKRLVKQDGLDDTNLKLRNNQYFRARNNAGTSDVGAFKVNASDLFEFGLKPQSAFTPASSNDLVNVSYLQSYVAGMRDLKDAVRAASTGDVSISSMPATIDGVTLLSGDRVALIKQTTGSENGIYIFNGVGVAATRSSDADENAEVTQGLSFDVVEGLVNGQKRYLLTTSGTIVVGTTSLTFVKVPNGPEIAIDKFESFTLSALNITNQYVDLANLAISDSVELFFQGVKQKHGVDYTLSNVSNVTRVTFAGDLATAGFISLIAGDYIEISYRSLV